MNELSIIIILVVCGVLQIMFFFKLWGMANNVIIIRDALKESTLIKDVKTAYFNGQHQIAKSLLDEGLRAALAECKENHYSKDAKNWKDRIIDTYKYLNIEMPNIEEEKQEPFDWDSNLE